jgi:VWFA-related protein
MRLCRQTSNFELRTSKLLAGIAVLLSASWPAAQTPGQRPTFRAESDLVPVHVAVRSGRKLVAGLVAADFEVSDNGVRQSIAHVSMETLPVDGTMLVDISGSVVRSLDRFRGDVRRMAGMLDADDQIRLITFESDVQQIVPMQPPSKRMPLDQIRTGNMTSLLDAMVFAMARAPRPDRRHLIFAFTDGYDNASVMGYTALPALASRTDAVLNVVLVKVTGVPDDGAPEAREALATAAARTGGSLYPPDDESNDVVNAFKMTLDAFRHSYVIYYRPTGVPAPGWHEITVRVTKSGSYEIASRQRYFGG